MSTTDSRRHRGRDPVTEGPGTGRRGLIVGLSSLVLISGLYGTSFAGGNGFPFPGPRPNYPGPNRPNSDNASSIAGLAAGGAVGGAVIAAVASGGAAGGAASGGAGGGNGGGNGNGRGNGRGEGRGNGEGEGEGEAEEEALGTQLGPVTAVRLVPSAREVEPGQRFAVDLQVKLRKDGRWHRAGNRPEATFSLQDPQGTGVMRFGNGGNLFSVPITLGPSANGRQVTVVARFAPADQPVRTANAVIRLKVTGEGAVSARR